MADRWYLPVTKECYPWLYYSIKTSKQTYTKNSKNFATGDNLVLFSKRVGMDPQQSFTGVADHTYIPQRTISVGLNITF
jgi:hypothetical protein